MFNHCISKVRNLICFLLHLTIQASTNPLFINNKRGFCSVVNLITEHEIGEAIKEEKAGTHRTSFNYNLIFIVKT